MEPLGTKRCCAAEDEELAQPSTPNSILSARGKSNNRFYNNFNFNRDRNSYIRQRPNYRGKYNANRNRNNNQQQQVYYNHRGSYRRGYNN